MKIKLLIVSLLTLFLTTETTLSAEETQTVTNVSANVLKISKGNESAFLNKSNIIGIITDGETYQLITTNKDLKITIEKTNVDAVLTSLSSK